MPKALAARNREGECSVLSAGDHLQPHATGQHAQPGDGSGMCDRLSRSMVKQ